METMSTLLQFLAIQQVDSSKHNMKKLRYERSITLQWKYHVGTSSWYEPSPALTMINNIKLRIRENLL